jgi:hypothetical protein
MSLFDSASIVVTPNAYKASKLYAIKPIDGSGDLTVVRATTATRVNSSGLISSVASNVPRLDYLNSTCPSILVEPQRTNASIYSEDFSNAVYTKNNSSITVNSIASPDGTTNADKLVESANFNFHRVSYIPILINTTYSVSVFAKKAERDYLVIRTGISGTNVNTCFDLNNGSVIFNGHLSSSIVDYGNGWYRCIVSETSPISTTINIGFLISNTPITNNNVPSYLGDGTSGIYLWGSQLEAGSKATSYIPTTTVSVTRNADLISKTGISSLIGQTEGTVLCDIKLTKLSEGKALFVIDNGTTNEYINLTRVSSNIFRLSIKKTGTSAVNIINSSVINDSRCRIAMAYKNGDYAMYVNGILRGTSTNSTDYPTTALTQFVLSNASYGSLNDSYNLISLWKTRLDNDTLATLTTI